MIERPVIENAPGLVWKRRKSGWNARWQARSDLRQRGFEPAEVNLWLGTEAELTDRLAGFIRDRCNLLQAEMLVWGRGGIPRMKSRSPNGHSSPSGRSSITSRAPSARSKRMHLRLGRQW